MASFRDVWNLIITGDTSDVERKLKGVGTTADATGATVETTFRGRMSNALGNFAQKIPGVSGLMDKFGVSSSQAGALMGTAVAGGALAAGAAVEKFAAASVQVFQEQSQEVLHFKQVTGLAADEASRFVAVADDFGVSASDLSTEIGRMNKVAEASPGKLAALGIELGKTKDGGYDAKQTFYNVVDAFNATDDASKRAAIGSEAFGKNWQSMTKLLDVGSTQLEESFGKVSDFQMFSDDDLKKSEDYRHAMDDLNDAVHGLERRVGEGLVPVLAKGATELAHMIEEAEKFGHIAGDVFGVVGADAGDFFKVLTNPGGYALDKVRDLGDAIGDLFGAGDDGDKLAKGFDNVANSSDKTTESILRDAAAIANQQDAVEKATAAAAPYIERTRDAIAAMDAQREATDKVSKALDDFRQSTHDVISEELGLEGATNTARDAVDNYTAKLLDGSSSTKDLRDSSLNAREALDHLAGQAVITAEKQAELEGKTLSASGKIDAQVSALHGVQDALAPGNPLRTWIDEYIQALLRIPGEVRTGIVVDGSLLPTLRPGQRFAGGTRSAPGGLALVGEQGPELVNLPGGSQVYPNGTGPGVGAPVYNITINATDPASVITAIKRYTQENGSGWMVA